MGYSQRNQEHYDEAYKHTLDNLSTYAAYRYLTELVLSSRYSASAMHAIAAGIQAALKDKGYL